MKTQMSFLLLWSWIWVAAAHAAQPSTNDVSARVFNSTDVPVSSLKPDGTRPICMRLQAIQAA